MVLIVETIALKVGIKFDDSFSIYCFSKSSIQDSELIFDDCKIDVLVLRL